MDQVQTTKSSLKALQRFPEIIKLTEARKRAIAGGRASIGDALKQMTMDSQRPSGNVLEYVGNKPTGSLAPETPAANKLRQQQALIDQARMAAYAAQNQTNVDQIHLGEAA